MQKTMKTLALGALLAVLGGGLANAAEQAMDCCAKCECCKDKKDAPKSFQQGPDHKH
ncbi:hypothetical protein [Phenylobacterium sp.]|uniref:hypothetical protein n=1 Tax=Phenylobacterium sp. TaxID=1871053 RepID=UPI0025EE251D|nr:hypothetical protein [Phenylobacterium sp.]